MVTDSSGKVRHVLLVTTPFPSHNVPFYQLLYKLNLLKNVIVTWIGHGGCLAEASRLAARGDFSNLDLRLESVFGDPPPYPDPDFPIRAATTCDAMQADFEPIRKRLIGGKNNVHAPTCMITDMFLWWSKDIADEIGIPWYTFYSTSAWWAICNMETQKLADPDLHPIRSPNRGQRIPISGLEFAHVYEISLEFTDFPEFYTNVTDRSLRGTGILVNQCREVDSLSLQAIEAKVQRRMALENGPETKVIPIGPLVPIPGFGTQYSANDVPCDGLKWLSTQAEKSVVYAAFGSLGVVSKRGTYHLARGLEESGVPFLWAVKMSPSELDQVLPEGFLERTQGRGYIETGWAPQTRILSHPAIGGFLTHAGWNSTMESVCAGVPLMTWPLSADQYMNARWITDVKKVGVTVMAGSMDWEVSHETVSKGVKLLMLEEEGTEIKKNAQELKTALTQAVSEGGSTFIAQRDFFNAIMMV